MRAGLLAIGPTGYTSSSLNPVLKPHRRFVREDSFHIDEAGLIAEWVRLIETIFASWLRFNLIGPIWRCYVGLRLFRKRTRSTVLGMIILMIFFRLIKQPRLLDRRHYVAAEEAHRLRNLLDEPSRFL